MDSVVAVLIVKYYFPYRNCHICNFTFSQLALSKLTDNLLCDVDTWKYFFVSSMKGNCTTESFYFADEYINLYDFVGYC